MTSPFKRGLALATRTVCLLGWLLLLTGLVLLVREMWARGDVAEGRKWFLAVDVGMVVVGAWFISPERTDQLIARVGTYLPVVGGRRAADRDEAERVALPATQLPPDQAAAVVVETIVGPSTAERSLPAPEAPPAPPVEDDPR